MAQYQIKNQIYDPEALKGFDLEGYYFDESSSTETDWTFLRD
jgi:cytoplasmic iron level regulating protein YaaA (DUF328/UPF0246 family)